MAFRHVRERATKRCSKYCIGMAVTGQISRWNRFLPTMRKLGLADGVDLKPCVATERRIGGVPFRVLDYSAGEGQPPVAGDLRP